MFITILQAYEIDLFFSRIVIRWSLLTMGGRLLACLSRMRSGFRLLCPYLGRRTCAWIVILWSTTGCLLHSWRDNTLRPHHFISRFVRCLSCHSDILEMVGLRLTSHISLSFWACHAKVRLHSDYSQTPCCLYSFFYNT